MDTEATRNKIDVIYDLREAVETKMHAEHELEQTGSNAARDKLLAAQLDVESKTQDAIDVCHECGHSHETAGEHMLPAVTGQQGNVIAVDFRRDATGV